MSNRRESTRRTWETRLRTFVRERILDRPIRPGPPDWGWVTAESATTPNEPLDEFAFFAVLGTWYEGDVVEATVRNAFRQGCTSVFLVDNASPDDTVARAVDAGATLSRTFVTDDYDEHLRMRLMHEVVDEVSAASEHDHVWWLWLDADEFHHGPAGRTLLEHLRTLDHRVRVVGARMFDHYPDRSPANVPGRHPLDYQPLCVETPWYMCAGHHRKHPLVRWDRHGPGITVGPGFHVASSDERPLLEAREPVFLHHFPFREETVSRRRFEALVGGAATAARARHDDAATHLRARWRSFDAVYRHKWHRVENLRMHGRGHGVDLLRWDQRVPARDVQVARWYPTPDDAPEP